MNKKIQKFEKWDNECLNSVILWKILEYMGRRSVSVPKECHSKKNNNSNLPKSKAKTKNSTSPKSIYRKTPSTPKPSSPLKKTNLPTKTKTLHLTIPFCWQHPNLCKTKSPKRITSIHRQSFPKKYKVNTNSTRIYRISRDSKLSLKTKAQGSNNNLLKK